MLATLERGIKGGKKCLFRRARANLLSLNPSPSGQRSLGAPLTGDPDAGKPPVRFGGRGEVTTLAPTPIVPLVCWKSQDTPDVWSFLRPFLVNAIFLVYISRYDVKADLV